jgi:hypothetical protein
MYRIIVRITNLIEFTFSSRSDRLSFRNLPFDCADLAKRLSGLVNRTRSTSELTNQTLYNRPASYEIANLTLFNSFFTLCSVCLFG